jgi:hypothetical protein
MSQKSVHVTTLTLSPLSPGYEMWFKISYFIHVIKRENFLCCIFISGSLWIGIGTITRKKVHRFFPELTVHDILHGKVSALFKAPFFYC